MSVREEVHHLIDALPDDQLPDLLNYLNELKPPVEFDEETKTAIAAKIDEGWAAAQRGELIGADEVRAQLHERKRAWRLDQRRA